LSGEEEKALTVAIKLGRLKEYLAIAICGGGVTYLAAIGAVEAEAVTAILGAIVGFVLGQEGVKRLRRTP